MPDHDPIDGLLTDALRAPVPELSPDFAPRLMARLQPRRVSAGGRLVLAAYGVCAFAVSVWAMQAVALGWPLIAASFAPPVAGLALVLRGVGRRPAAG